METNKTTYGLAMRRHAVKMERAILMAILNGHSTKHMVQVDSNMPGSICTVLTGKGGVEIGRVITRFLE